MALASALASSLWAFQVRKETSRFDALARTDPSEIVGVKAVTIEEISGTPQLSGAWTAFRAEYGAGWAIRLDARSGAPLLAQGPGIGSFAPASRGLAGPGSSPLDSLELASRSFLAHHQGLGPVQADELILNPSASGQLDPESWQVVFDHVIDGIPVEGDRYVFLIGHGNLIAFGAPRWVPAIESAPSKPSLSRTEALSRLRSYMELKGTDEEHWSDSGTLRYVPMAAPMGGAGIYEGTIGEGYTASLAWHFEVRVAGEPGRWSALVDAHDGTILALADRNLYAWVHGGVYPVSNDGACPDGCEQSGFPMPFADITSETLTSTAGASGQFVCPGGDLTATTTLAGPYVAVHDTCGALSATAACGSDLDLRSSGSTDCAVPAGASAGDTHAARTGFYHLNRIIEKARSWLPGNAWLSAQLTDNVNLFSTCNAFWDGTSVNFYRSGGGCRNTGEIAGVFLHEWGHGLDENDGGGVDNPSEAYADVTALLQTHASCMGRGFYQGHPCTGYGDACLSCTGIRELDWNQRADHAPSTPQGFLLDYCPSGTGPCGREVHCEGYVAAETLWDFAARDLPASGLDAATSWQIAEKLWYRSRLGSGGRAYNCALPASDGCLATSWFTKMRAVDDDDGDLSNGTPHAAELFAAFARHGIACGAASDAANQDQTVCLPLAAPEFIATAGSESASLSWSAVPGAASYRLLRNDIGCAAGSTLIAEVPGTSYTDAGLANGFTQYYEVQAVGSNSSCDGPLSACRFATPQPYAGSVALDRALYGCSGLLQVTVRDANVGAPTLSVAITSGSEPTAETLVLTQLAPGSASYGGTIAATPGPPANDGMISLANGDAIHVQYVDADDGQGHAGYIRQAGAAADCVPPIITAVGAQDVAGRTATIVWQTNEAAGGTVHYGPAGPGPGSTSGASGTTSHAVPLAGLEECTDYLYAVESTDPQGNTAQDDNGGAAYTFRTGRNTHPEYASTGPPVPIPDNDPQGAQSVIAVTDQKPILDVNVEVNLTHTYDGDLVVSLITPTGAHITLANRRGRSGRNFEHTLFDDEAATPIGEGLAPFTGSFAPDRPLDRADGITAEGDWTLKVVDADVNDVGTINSWKLLLTYPDADCGPHAAFADQSLELDSCASGGPGSKNGVPESGEIIEFSVGIVNDGTAPLTGVSVRVVSETPGVTMLRDVAPYDPISPGGTGTQSGPPFEAQLAAALPCGSAIHFLAEVSSSQGTWSSLFAQTLGAPVSGTVVPLSENFTHGIPSSWTIVNGGTGGGSAATWTTANPGNRSFAPPLAQPVAMVDSDKAGTSAVQDEQLITPVMNMTAATSAVVDFDEYFQWYDAGHDEKGDLDVRSSRTGGAWVNVDRNQGGSSFNPEHHTVDISPQAAGASGVQLRFHYYDASFEWWWEIDNIVVTTTAVIACSMNPCVPVLGPPPVPDGTFGVPMTAVRSGAAGSSIDLEWDVSACSAADYHLLYGPLASVAGMSPSGGVCDLGKQGSATWNGVPEGNLWFVMVSDDAQGEEGTWGLDSDGNHRGGTAPSHQCGFSARNNSGECPGSGGGAARVPDRRDGQAGRAAMRP